MITATRVVETRSDIWCSVQLGDYSSMEVLIKALQANGYTVGASVTKFVNTLPIQHTRSSVNLVIKTVGDLGFARCAGYKDIINSAMRRGLSLCHVEMGALLRLKYSNQPVGEFVMVASAPMGPVSDPSIFRVSHALSLFWLRGDPVGNSSRWADNVKFVFELPN